MVTEYVASRRNNILSMIHEEIAYISSEAWQRLVSTFTQKKITTVLATHGRQRRNNFGVFFVPGTPHLASTLPKTGVACCGSAKNADVLHKDVLA